MVSSLGLFIIAAAVASTYGANINVTTSAQDYATISQHELLHEINLVDVEVAAVDARYADRLDVIQYQQKKVLLEILHVNRTIMPMEALSLSRKHCIQKYDSQFVSYEYAKVLLDLCYNQAVNSGKSLTSTAKSYNSYARSAVVNQLPKNTASCDSWYAKNQTALELCYIDAVATAENSVQIQLQLSRNALEKSLYDSEVYSRIAVDCSFEVEQNTLETIGKTIMEIDVCADSLKKGGAISTSISEKGINNLKKLESVSGH